MNEEQGNFKGREFICSCGKNYLSYAALFTHIKQKHDGKVLDSSSRRPAPSLDPDPKEREVVLGRILRLRTNARAQVLLELFSESDKPQNGISKSSDNNNIT